MNAVFGGLGISHTQFLADTMRGPSNGAGELPTGGANIAAHTGQSASSGNFQLNKNNVATTPLEQLNHKLYPQGLQAVFQYDNKSHMTWLNVVNKATGQVVDRYPPEKIREMVDAAANAGLSYDKRL